MAGPPRPRFGSPRPETDSKDDKVDGKAAEPSGSSSTTSSGAVSPGRSLKRTLIGTGLGAQVSGNKPGVAEPSATRSSTSSARPTSIGGANHKRTIAGIGGLGAGVGAGKPSLGSDPRPPLGSRPGKSGVGKGATPASARTGSRGTGERTPGFASKIPGGRTITGLGPSGGVGSGVLGKGIGATSAKTSPTSTSRSVQPRPVRTSMRPLGARRESAKEDVEPAVLFVGADEGYGEAVAKALERHGVFLETAQPGTAVDMAVVAAPDLIVLTGVAAKESGKALLAELSRRAETSVIPVALVQDDVALDARLRAFRFGAAAILPKKASVDELATKIASLARDIPNREGESLGELGEVTLEELVKTLGDELRSGILSVQGKDKNEAIRLVLGNGRPVARLIEDFVRKTRQHVLSAEPLRYEFDARAGGTISLLDAESDDERGAIDLSGLRIVLADSDSSRADGVAQQLRHVGAEVIVTDLAPGNARFDQMRHADPAVLLIGESQLQGDGYELVRRMRRDTRLRWASLLVVRWDELWTDKSTNAVDRLANALAELAAPEDTLRLESEGHTQFDSRLETLGPARSLRSLSRSKQGLRVQVHNPRVRIELDVADGLLVGAYGRTLDEQPSRELEGITAVAAFLQLSSGRMRIEQAAHPVRANVMSMIDMALGLADGEAPPILPSHPAGPPSNPAPGPAIPAAARTPLGHAVSSSAMNGSAIHGSAIHGPPSAAPPEPPPPAPVPPQPSAVAAPAAPPPSATAPVDVLGSTAMALDAPSIPPAAPPPPVPDPELFPSPATVASPSDETGIDERLRSWLGIQDNRPTPRLMAILGALAGIQLITAIAFIAWSTPSKAAEVRPSPTVDAPLADAAPPAGAPQASGGAARREVPPPKPAAEEPKPAEPEPDLSPPYLDGSGGPAPSCESTYGSDPPRPGRFAGAAYNLAQKGRKALVIGDVPAAQGYYCRAAAWDKSNPSIYVSLAQVFLLLRDGNAAIKPAEHAFKLAANDGPIQRVLGDALARTGEVERARQLWITAAGLSEGDPASAKQVADRDIVHAGRAVRRGDYVQAERLYRRVAVLQPQRVDGPIGLAQSLIQLDDDDAAAKWARYATAIEPGNSDAFVALGDVLEHQGKKEQAREAWTKALDLDRGNAAARARLD